MQLSRAHHVPSGDSARRAVRDPSRYRSHSEECARGVAALRAVVLKPGAVLEKTLGLGLQVSWSQFPNTVAGIGDVKHTAARIEAHHADGKGRAERPVDHLPVRAAVGGVVETGVGTKVVAERGGPHRVLVQWIDGELARRPPAGQRNRMPGHASIVAPSNGAVLYRSGAAADS